MFFTGFALVTRSYVKMYGPPILKGIRELEKISLDMPEVSIMNTSILHEITRQISREGSPLQTIGWIAELAMTHFASSGVSLPAERRSSIISKSVESLGEYDFFFEWFRKPNQEQLNELIGRIDEGLAHLGCRYTITTK